MPIPNNTSEIVAVIASLGLLTPLVKALHRWHIDLRKVSKSPKSEEPRSVNESVQPSSRWSRLSRFDRFKFVYGAVGHMLCLIFLLISMLLPPHAATSRDVAMASILVLSALSVGRFMEE